MEANFGVNTEQYFDAVRDLNAFDDNELKHRAKLFKEFVFKENEKPTRAFCLLGKENNLVDDIVQIKNADGDQFTNDKDRSEYIKGFYSELYKKRLDNLMSIEEFLTNEALNEEWVLRKKLNNDEKLMLEQDVTLDELKAALKTF